MLWVLGMDSPSIDNSLLLVKEPKRKFPKFIHGSFSLANLDKCRKNSLGGEIIGFPNERS